MRTESWTWSWQEAAIFHYGPLSKLDIILYFIFTIYVLIQLNTTLELITDEAHKLLMQLYERSFITNTVYIIAVTKHNCPGLSLEKYIQQLMIPMNFNK